MITPTASDRTVRFADFPTLTQALDFAATGETGINLYSLRGELVEALPYAKLRDEAVVLARRLLATGAKVGDSVALLAETDGDFVRAFFACQYAGLLPASVVGAPGAPPRWDLLVHEQDLREALDLERAPEDTWRTLLPEVVERLGRRPASVGFDVTTTESTWRIGAPTTAITFAAEDYELLRVLFSRRTTFEIGALTDGVGVLEGVAVFGPRPG